MPQPGGRHRFCQLAFRIELVEPDGSAEQLLAAGSARTVPVLWTQVFTV